MFAQNIGPEFKQNISNNAYIMMAILLIFTYKRKHNSLINSSPLKKFTLILHLMHYKRRLTELTI